MSDDKNVNLRFIIIALTLLLIGAVLLFFGLKQNTGFTDEVVVESSVVVSPTQVQKPLAEAIQSDELIVTRVVDGDTIVVSSGEKVRYIGVDTPETVDPRRGIGCFGKEASSENKQLVEGKTVILVKDISEKDKFDRLLRLVYLKQDNGNFLFVNDYLIRQGFAKASTYPPDVKFSSQFINAEKEARENERGLWKMCQ